MDMIAADFEGRSDGQVRAAIGRKPSINSLSCWQPKTNFARKQRQEVS